MKSGPTLNGCTVKPRLRSAAIRASATVVLPTPLCVPAMMSRRSMKSIASVLNQGGARGDPADIASGQLDLQPPTALVPQLGLHAAVQLGHLGVRGIRRTVAAAQADAVGRDHHERIAVGGSSA